jgi:Ala-tRNA(Pro) deacylase
VKLLGDDRLSFGSPDRLMNHLGLTPGAVSPFGLLNDAAHRVQVVLDADLRRADRLVFHPNVNTASVTISFADLQRFLTAQGNPVRFVTVS